MRMGFDEHVIVVVVCGYVMGFNHPMAMQELKMGVDCDHQDCSQIPTITGWW